MGSGIREYDGSGNGTDGALGSGTREYDGPGNGTDGVLGSGTREYDGSGNGTNGVLGSGTRKYITPSSKRVVGAVDTAMDSWFGYMGGSKAHGDIKLF
ncbi:hypothetical protein Tco_0719618 [Tanacetum coccineum]